MDKNWKYLVVAIVIVFFLPTLLIFNRQRGEGDTVKSTEHIRTVSAEKSLVSVLDTNGTVTMMEIGDYLTGVVLCEMPVTFSTEALKAQAVVARTYALRRMEKSKHDNSAVCTESGCCQGFKSVADFLASGGEESDVEKVRDAVADTKELVLTYNGELIDATYFSCSGGTTEDAVAVWGKDVPYLRATESPGEEMATHYTDEVSFSPEELAGLLSVSTEKPLGAWVESVTFTAGGGVDEIVICGKTFSGVEIRKRLGLRSTAFTVAEENGKIVITTKGYGHRVGMSQYGAEAMALNGATYEEILCHYYTGVEVSLYTQED